MPNSSLPILPSALLALMLTSAPVFCAAAETPPAPATAPAPAAKAEPTAKSATAAPAGAATAAVPPAPANLATPAPATPDNAAAFLGTWVLTTESEMGPGRFEIVIKSDAGKVVAELNSEMQPTQAVKEITRVGTGISLRYDLDFQGNPVPVRVDLTAPGEKMAGKLDFADGAFSMSGTVAKKAK